jgi:hypothetical protein
MVPRSIVRVDALPRNANGKVDKLALLTVGDPAPASESRPYDRSPYWTRAITGVGMSPSPITNTARSTSTTPVATDR